MHGYDMQVMLSLSTYYIVGPDDRVSRGNLTSEDEARIDDVCTRLCEARGKLRTSSGVYRPGEWQEIAEQSTEVHLDVEEARLFEMMIGACLRELADPAAMGPYISPCTRDQAVQTHMRLQSLLERNGG